MENIPLNYDVAVDEVDVFKKLGNFTNNLDSFGNYQLVFSVAQSMDGNLNYVKVPVKTFVYNDDKILDSNSIEFAELQTLQVEEKRDTLELLNQYNNLLEENRLLNQTLAKERQAQIAEDKKKEKQRQRDKEILKILNDQIEEKKRLKNIEYQEN
jgi:hypothetical protein